MDTTRPTSAPRLLLFPQVGRPDAKEGRPPVRRYTLTLLPGLRRAERGGCASKPSVD